MHQIVLWAHEVAAAARDSAPFCLALAGFSCAALSQFYGKPRLWVAVALLALALLFYLFPG